MFCPNCGSQIADNSQFCPACGQSTAIPGGAPAPPPYSAPAGPQPFAVPPTANMEIGKWIGEGWRMVTGDLGVFLVATLLLGVICGVVPLLLNGPLFAGMHILCMNKMLRGRTEIGDMFKGFNYFVPTLVAAILTSIFIFIGSLLCIVPGLVLAACYMFVYLLILDRKMDFWPAMEACHEIAKKHWGGLLMFLLAMLCVHIVGALACLVGLLVTIPLQFVAVTAAYRDLFGFQSSGVD